MRQEKGNWSDSENSWTLSGGYTVRLNPRDVPIELERLVISFDPAGDRLPESG
jgi:hypothetical protein